MGEFDWFVVVVKAFFIYFQCSHFPSWSHSFVVSARSFASQSKEDEVLEASSSDEGFICPLACPSSKSVSTTSAFFFFRWTLGGSFTRRMSAFSSATVNFWRRFLILSTPSSSQFAQEAKITPTVIPSSIPVLSKAKKIKEPTTGNCGQTETWRNYSVRSASDAKTPAGARFLPATMEPIVRKWWLPWQHAISGNGL